jgi:uncharacterized protein DUF1963
MIVHSRLDIARWMRVFPLSRLRGEARDFVLVRRRERPQEYLDAKAVDAHIQLMHPKWEIVVGPAAVAVNEQLRAEALSVAPHTGARFPTDVAVWAKGEPVHRSVTKIGGLPYRPLHAPWPEGDIGQPMRFVGQLCFVDSRDIVPALPGDVLLVFGDDDALLSEPERLVFEWWPLTDAPLVSEAPAVDELLAPFHAELHRTEDWDDAIFAGTKIGGLPKFIQEDPGAPGSFIGAIGSISVPSDERYPFVNVPEPLGESNENMLMIGDMGSLYLYIGFDGTTHASSQCY